MKIIKDKIKKIFKFFGFILKEYSEYNLEQLNFSALNFPKNNDFFLRKYKTRSGKEFNLYKNYRYSLKKSYLSYPPLRNLFHLSNNIKHNKKIKNKLKEFIGSHTLTCPLSEIITYTNEIISNYSDFFIQKNNIFYPKINKKDFLFNLKKQTEWTKYYLKIYGLNNKRMKILEVGPGSGMFSISLSLLGHQVIGIDKNYYKHDKYPQILRGLYNKFSGAKVNFIDADIHKFKNFNNNYFDLIVSISVLEHVKDFPLLLNKFKKILHKKWFSSS